VSHVSDVTLLRRRYRLLPDGILPRVEEHLAECGACRTRSEKLEQSWKVFDDWSVPPLSETDQKQALAHALTTPMRRPIAPPPRPRGDERAANQAAEKMRSEDTRSSEPSAKGSPALKYVAWGLFLLAAILLGVSAALWGYLRSVKISAVLAVTGPEEVEPGSAIGVRAQFTTAAGLPIEGAKVTVSLRGEASSEQRDATTTDARGEAVLRFIVPNAGEYTARITAQKEVEQSVDLLLSSRARHQIFVSLFGAPAELGGELSAKAKVMTSGGKPLPNALILFEVFEPSGTRVARVERPSDSQGGATLSLPLERWAREGLWTISATVGAAHSESNFDVTAPTKQALWLDASARALPDGSVEIKAYVQDAKGFPLIGTITAKGKNGETSQPTKNGEVTLSLVREEADEVELILEAQGITQKETLQVERGLRLSFAPENGAFHKALPLRGTIQVRNNKEPKMTKISIFSEAEEVVVVESDSHGYAQVDLPAKVLGKELTFKSEGVELKLTPPVKDGPAVQCDRVLTIVGRPVSCVAFYPKQTPSLLLVSQRGRLLASIPLSASQKNQSIEIPVTAPGILEVGFGGADDLYSFIYATTSNELKITGTTEISINNSVVPVNLTVQNANGSGVVANLSAGVLVEAPNARLPTSNELEASFLLSSYSGIPAQVQDISTITKDGPHINGLRRDYGERLRWVVTAIVLLFVLGVGCWVWAMNTAFFWVILPSAFFSTLAGLLLSLWLIPLLFVLLLFLVVWRRPQLQPSIGSWVASVAAMFGVWFSAHLWAVPLPMVSIPNSEPPRPRAAPASPLPQIQALEAPFSLFTTDASGKTHWDVPRGKKTTRLHLYTEAISQNGFGSSVLSMSLDAPAFMLSMPLPKTMIQGDRITVPIFARSLNNSDEVLSLDVSADNGLDFRGASTVWQRSKGAIAAEAELTAKAIGPSLVSLKGIDATNATTPLLQETLLMVAPKNALVTRSQWGRVDGLVDIVLPPKTSSAKIWLFQQEFAVALWRLSQPLQPLGCTIEHAARLELLALLLQKQNTEELQRWLRMSLEALAAAEVEGGGFSNCGAERFDLFTTALTMIALRNVAETSAIAPLLVARARAAVAENISKSKPQAAEAAFYAWALQTAGSAADANVQKIVDVLLQSLPATPDLPPYALSIATVALQKGAKTEKAQTYQKALSAFLAPGYSLVNASQPSISGAVGMDADIEATYFAALAFPKGSTEREQLTVALENSSPQSNILFSWVLRTLLLDAAEAQEINTSVIAGGTLTAKLTQEKPTATYSLDFGARPLNTIQMKADGKFIYLAEFISQPIETPPTLELKWPERLQRNDSFTVEVSSPVPSESILMLPLPSTIDADLPGLYALQDAGAIGRFGEFAGVLWVVIPTTTSPLSLPLKAVRAGLVSIARAQLFTINAASKKSQSAPGRLEVRP
jgi:hypothetical protein